MKTVMFAPPVPRRQRAGPRMRSLSRSFTVGLLGLLLAAGAAQHALGSSPARDDPGLADHWQFRDSERYRELMRDAAQDPRVTELVDYARYLSQSGYPQTDQAVLDGRHLQNFHVRTLVEALRRTRGLDDCLAAVDLRVFLAGNLDEMTDARQFLLLGEVGAIWLPDFWFVADRVSKLFALKNLSPFFKTASLLSNVLSSYDALVAAAAGTAAGQRGRWAFNVYEQSRREAWSPEQVEREREQRFEAKLAELDRLTAVKTEAEAAMVVAAEQHEASLSVLGQRLAKGLADEELRHAQALELLAERLQEGLQRVADDEAAEGELARRIEWQRAHPDQTRPGEFPIAGRDQTDQRYGYLVEAWPSWLCVGSDNPDCGRHYRQARTEVHSTISSQRAREHARHTSRLAQLHADHLARQSAETVRHQAELIQMVREYEVAVHAHLVEITRLHTERTTLRDVVQPLAEDDCERLRAPGLVAQVLNAQGARIIRDDPALGLRHGPGEPVFSASGAWVQAYGGWRTEEQPPNHPQTVDAGVVDPGVYEMVLNYAPSVPDSMTAGNHNTSMRVYLSAPWLPSGHGTEVGHLRPQWNHQPEGEARLRVTLDRPGRLRAVFGMATSRGQAGGYAEHAQRYSGQVRLLEPLADQAALPNTGLRSGDVLRTGASHASVTLTGGGTLRVSPNSTLRIDEGPDNELIVQVERGSARFTRSARAEPGLAVVYPGRRKVELRETIHGVRVSPLGTDVSIGAEGVSVHAGRVVLDHGDSRLTLDAGERYLPQQRTIETLDVDAGGAHAIPLSADGMPAERRYWDPLPLPHGPQPAILDDGSRARGWWLADPPVRWERGRGRIRAEVTEQGDGRFSLRVPANSRLEFNDNSAPRFLHPVSGDVDLRATVRIDPAAAGTTAVRYLLRTPGRYPGGGGLLNSDGIGPGTDLAVLGTAVQAASSELLHLPLLNQPSASRWPTAAAGTPVHLRLLRRGALWIGAWSLDGENWQTSHIALKPDVPDTAWVGFVFTNNARNEAQTAEVHLDALHLDTAPGGTQAPPAWFAVTQAASLTVLQSPGDAHPLAGGRARTDDGSGAFVGARGGVFDERLQLRLDAGPEAWARVFSGMPLGADVDVEIAVQVASEGEAGGAVRWSLAAVTPEEAGVAVLSERIDGLLRHGLLANPRGGYPGSGQVVFDEGRFDEERVRLRLVRESGQLRGYVWRGDRWDLYRALPGTDAATAVSDGPLLLRLEASRSGRGSEQGSWLVDIEVGERYTRLADRWRVLGEAEQARGDAVRAVRHYQQALALRPDPALNDRLERLHAWLQVASGPALGTLLSVVEPGDTADTAIRLYPDQLVSAELRSQEQHWFRVQLPQAGSLSATLVGYASLRSHLQLLAGTTVLERRQSPTPMPGPLTAEALSLVRDDLDAGEYWLTVRHGGGHGPYQLLLALEPNLTPADPEPNDSAEQAQDIPFGALRPGQLGYRSGEGSDVRDWYAVSVDEPGDVWLTMHLDPTLNASLLLFDPEGRRELARDVGSDGEPLRHIHHPALAPGRYLIRIDRRSGHGGYQLHPMVGGPGGAGK